MYRDSFNFIILRLQKFERYNSTKIWHIYIYFNIKIFESKTSKYFNTLCIYTIFTLKLIFHHLIMKINIQNSKHNVNVIRLLIKRAAVILAEQHGQI